MAQHTRNAIRQAFLDLLNERALDKISIKDIAEKSEVNRNTFYYYYGDIYALVEDIFEMEIEKIAGRTGSYSSWQEAFLDATAFAVSNKRAVYHLFNSSNRSILEQYYHKTVLAAMTAFVRKEAEGLPAQERDILTLARFYTAALTGLTADWLRNGMKEDSNAYIDDLGRLLDGDIRLALERSCQ